MIDKIHVDKISLIGLSLGRKTTNENGQSNIDCGNLWQRFEKEKYFSRIPNKINDEILAVYHEYEGDYMAPFSYFIGCKVPDGTTVPEGMDSITISPDVYQKFVAKGQMPHCIGEAWKGIWQSNAVRTYRADFEVYGEKSRDWNNAEVDIYISVVG